MKVTEHEMRGLLTGKCVPADMLVNEEIPAYLVRKFAALQQRLDAELAESPDKRRMDWLVSKCVEVREPLRYGSAAIFHAQAITDEEDDHHATKLREQIDEAMRLAP